MMNELKSREGYVELNDIPMPESLYSKMHVDKRDMVVISPIDDEYYGKIGDSIAMLWGRGKLMRRKYDYKGEFIMKDGNYVWTDVSCPSDCVAVVSDKSIGVPNSYKPKEHFEYVDMISRKVDGVVQHKFVYIIPRKYCYKVNQTALVLSWTKLRVYYSGVNLAMQNGHRLFVYIIPYKPTSGTMHNYRVIMSKPSIDYAQELAEIQKYWVENKIIFDPAHCELYEQVRGLTNTAVQVFDGVLDEYIMFDSNKPLGEIDSLEDEIMEGEDGNVEDY